MQTANTPKNQKWDSICSTYYWHINLSTEFQYNGVKQLTGYSKKVGQNEAVDKDQLLKRKIVNLFLNDYLNRITSIEIYRREQESINKKTDPCILVLYPKNYDIPEARHEEIFRKMAPFLKDFYYRVTTGKKMEGILPNARKFTNLDEIFDVNAYEFASVAHLYSQATRWLTHGHPEGQVNQFITKYKARKNW